MFQILLINYDNWSYNLVKMFILWMVLVRDNAHSMTHSYALFLSVDFVIKMQLLWRQHVKSIQTFDALDVRKVYAKFNFIRDIRFRT